MVIVYMMHPEDRIWISKPSIVFPAAYIHGGTIILDGKHYDEAILLSPYGIYLCLKNKTEKEIVDFIEELVIHECIHMIEPKWNHQTTIIKNYNYI